MNVHDNLPIIGVILGGKPYRIRLQYPGERYYPSGPWYDIPELVADLDNNKVMRYRSPNVRPMWKLSVTEFRMFSRADDITHLRDNARELTRLKKKNATKKKV